MWKKYLIVSLVLFISSYNFVSAQVIADGLPGCVGIANQVGMLFCGGGTNSFFGINGAGQFEVTNVDGEFCCASGGDWNSYFEFETINISCFTNVSFSLNYSAANTTYEDQSLMPLFGCTGTPVDNGHDQIVFYYSLDGGPFIESLYVHGTTQADFTGTWSVSGLVGNSLTIRVYASNKASAESFYFDNLEVTAPNPFVSAGPDQDICGTNMANLLGIGSGTWSGGLGVISDPTDPLATYTADPSEIPGMVTITYTSCTATTACGAIYPPVSDDVVITFANPTANAILIDECSASLAMYDLTSLNTSVNMTETVNWYIGQPSLGGTQIADPTIANIVPPVDLWALVIDANGCATEVFIPVITQAGPTASWDILSDPVEICEGECVVLPMIISGGVPPYMIDFSGQVNIIGVPIISNQVLNYSAVENTLTFCLFGATVLDPVQWSDPSNSVNVFDGILDFPFFASSGTLTINSITDAAGCTTVVNDQITLTLGTEPMATATTLSECDNGGGQATFDLTLAESSILTGGLGSVTFYSDVAATMMIANPTAYVSAGGTVYAQVTEGGCSSIIVSVGLIVLATEDGSFSFTDFCETDATNGPTMINTPGGTFTFMPDPGDGATIDPNTGMISNGIGGNSYTVSYMTAGACPGTSAQTLTITNPVMVTLTPIADLCDTDLAVMLNTTQGGISGSWNGAGVSGTSFDPSGLGGMTVTLTFVPDPAAGCFDNTDLSVVVNTTTTLADPGFGPICDAQSLNLGNILSGVNGSWSGPGVIADAFIPPALGSAVYMLTFTPTTSTCISPLVTSISVEPSIVLNNPGNINNCNSVLLPTIIGTGLTGNELYYSGPLGSGTSFAPGSVINTPGTYYIYDLTADPNCINNPSFTISIDPSPDIIAFPNPIQACSSVTLQPITGTNLSGTAAYYDGPNGTGSIIPIGTVFTANTTIYAYDETAPGCNDEEILNIEIVSDITIVNPGNQQACPVYILPAISGSATALYFDMPNGGGNSYMAGDTVFADLTLYIFDGLSSCVNNNDESFMVDVVVGPLVNPVETNTYCDSFMLETITGTDLSGNEAYYDLPLGMGNSFNAGDIISSSMQLYVYDTDGLCFSQDTFTITIENTLSAGDGGSVIVCQGDAGLVDLAGANTGVVDAGGTWSDDDLTNVDLINVSAVDFSSLAVGMYDFSYSIDQNVCQDDTATVTINVVDSPDAGNNAMISLCNGGSTQIDFYSEIGNPDIGGVWMQTSGMTPINTDDPTVVDFSVAVVGTYNFSYTIPAVGTCQGGQSILTIEVIASPDAGQDAMIDVCEGSILNLFDQITTTDLSGIFTDQMGTILTVDGSYTATTSSTPVILYVLTGDPLCGSDMAMINLQVSSSISAGDEVTQELCVAEELDLSTILQNAASGGTFQSIGVSPALVGSMFTAQSMDVGQTYDYFYIVGDGVSCPLDSTIISIDILDTPSATLSIVGSFDCQEDCIDLRIDFMGSPSYECELQFEDQTGQLRNFTLQEPSFNELTLTLCNLNNSLTITGASLGQEETIGSIDGAYTIRLLSVDDVNCTNTNMSISETIDPTINTAMLRIDGQRCADEQIVVNGVIYDKDNPSGTEMVPIGTGCDSIYTIDLNFLPENIESFTDVYCDDETVMIASINFSASYTSDTIVLEAMDINGCDSIIRVNLSFLETSENLLDLLLCEGESVEINGVIYDDDTLDTQVLQGQAANGCDSIIDVMVSITPELQPTILASNLSTNTYELSGDISLAGLNYEWSSSAGILSCLDCPNPSIIIDQNTEISLVFFDQDCIQNASYTLLLESIDLPIYVPNVFSPNNDGANDRFNIFSAEENILIQSMSIYDRWGELVYFKENFLSSDADAGWDGTFKGEDLNPGVYVYMIKAIPDINTGVSADFIGDVSLIK